MLAFEAFKKLPVFITTMSRWDGDISSASLALAKVFSRTNPVYYIDYPYSWADVYRERNLPSVRERMPALLWRKNWQRNIPGQSTNFVAVTPGPTLPISSLPMSKLYVALSDVNNKKVAAAIKKICRQHNYHDFIFINSFNPYYFQEVEKYLHPTLSVYHSRDAIEEVPGNGLPNEIHCVQHYELAMATSTQLCRNISARTGKTVEYFPNGGDATLFKTALNGHLARPKELENIHTKIIGYTGAICQRFDYDLLAKLAATHYDKTIVLVGPRRDKQFSHINLDDIPNIVFTGAKRIEELPAYLQYFDCAILPFKKNNLTAGIYPLKINEYLAAGKAVVTTNFSEDIKSFGSHVFLAEKHQQFIDLVETAIACNDDAVKLSRYEVAENNSWEKRVEKFWPMAWNYYQQKSNLK